MVNRETLSDERQKHAEHVSDSTPPLGPQQSDHAIRGATSDGQRPSRASVRPTPQLCHRVRARQRPSQRRRDFPRRNGTSTPYTKAQNQIRRSKPSVELCNSVVGPLPCSFPTSSSVPSLVVRLSETCAWLVRWNNQRRHPHASHTHTWRPGVENVD